MISITDPQKVQYAVEFILKREDRWGDRITPYGPTLVLQFYAGERRLGGYGISSDVLIALPTQYGFWWRDVAPAEISQLLKTLEIEMPRRSREGSPPSAPLIRSPRRGGARTYPRFRPSADGL
jgi:hypothetical protein